MGIIMLILIIIGTLIARNEKTYYKKNYRNWSKANNTLTYHDSNGQMYFTETGEKCKLRGEGIDSYLVSEKTGRILGCPYDHTSNLEKAKIIERAKKHNLKWIYYHNSKYSALINLYDNMEYIKKKVVPKEVELAEKYGRYTSETRFYIEYLHDNKPAYILNVNTLEWDDSPVYSPSGKYLFTLNLKSIKEQANTLKNGFPDPAILDKLQEYMDTDIPDIDPSKFFSKEPVLFSVSDKFREKVSKKKSIKTERYVYEYLTTRYSGKYKGKILLKRYSLQDAKPFNWVEEKVFE